MLIAFGVFMVFWTFGVFWGIFGYFGFLGYLWYSAECDSIWVINRNLIKKFFQLVKMCNYVILQILTVFGLLIEKIFRLLDYVIPLIATVFETLGVFWVFWIFLIFWLIKKIIIEGFAAG
jgi:hypothetical protein